MIITNEGIVSQLNIIRKSTKSARIKIITSNYNKNEVIIACNF